jgi:hypothetical protein
LEQGVTPAEQAGLRLDEALARLAALRPFQDTARDKELMAKAWDRAWEEMVVTVKEWLEG